MSISEFKVDKKTGTITSTYEPQPRQMILHNTQAKQILYGGAAGGGKSHSIRWDAYQFCLENPGLRAYLFRKTRPQLKMNHLDFIREEIPDELAKYAASENCLNFKNDSILYFCYCDGEKDVYQYHGAEIHWLGIDEATMFSKFQIDYLRTRVRLGGFAQKAKQLEYLPRIIYSTNPQGGPGHSYLKRVFIDQAPPEHRFYDKTSSVPEKKDRQGNVIKKARKGFMSIYIPAKMDDNKYLDEDYEGVFTSLEPELARALRDGDWDAVTGAALHNLSREKHQIRQFKPMERGVHDDTRHWTHFMSMDWGTARPYSIGWYCVCEGGMTLKGRDGGKDVYVPDGAVIRYAEDYGWDGTENKGVRLPSDAVARRIRHLEKEWNLPVMDYRVADYQMWSQTDGPTPAEKMLRGGILLQKAQKDRKINYEEILSRLSGSPTYRDDGKSEDHPMFYVTSNCSQFWRTIPSLILDTTDPDKGPGITPAQEDHVYDEMSYALRSRPFVTSAHDRYMDKYGDEIKKAMAGSGKSVDPYSTR